MAIYSVKRKHEIKSIMSVMDGLKSEVELAEYLQNILIARATGGGGVEDAADYRSIRRTFIKSSILEPLLPRFIRTCRDLSQFWSFIKFELPSYALRRNYIWNEFRALMDYLEDRNAQPADQGISLKLRSFDVDGVHVAWTKALERRTSDPERAITAARTLIETVCKHILDDGGKNYDSHGIDLPELYKLTSQHLNLAPSQHTQETFKKILGGVTSVVNELGSLRNRLSDAHGQGRRPVRPSLRHAELAVNLAGAIALFLVDTHLSKKELKDD